MFLKFKILCEKGFEITKFVVNSLAWGLTGKGGDLRGFWGGEWWIFLKRGLLLITLPSSGMFFYTNDEFSNSPTGCPTIYFNSNTKYPQLDSTRSQSCKTTLTSDASCSSLTTCTSDQPAINRCSHDSLLRFDNLPKWLTELRKAAMFIHLLQRIQLRKSQI